MKYIIMILCLLLAGPVFALDSLGVTDTTGLGGFTGITGRHTVGWIADYFYTTNDSDTVLVNAVCYYWAVGEGGACSTVVSVYDSLTGTLQAQSDTFILGSMVEGRHEVIGSISGTLSPNTAYHIGVQHSNDATAYNRPLGKTVTWGDIRRLDAQGLTPPADLSGHAADNQNLFYGFVTAEPGEAGEEETTGRRRRLLGGNR